MKSNTRLIFKLIPFFMIVSFSVLSPIKLTTLNASEEMELADPADDAAKTVSVDPLRNTSAAENILSADYNPNASADKEKMLDEKYSDKINQLEEMINVYSNQIGPANAAYQQAEEKMKTTHPEYFTYIDGVMSSKDRDALAKAVLEDSAVVDTYKTSDETLAAINALKEQINAEAASEGSNCHIGPNVGNSVFKCDSD